MAAPPPLTPPMSPENRINPAGCAVGLLRDWSVVAHHNEVTGITLRSAPDDLRIAGYASPPTRDRTVRRPSPYSWMATM